MSLAQFSLAGLAPTRHHGVLGAAVLIFAAGFMTGAIVRPVRQLTTAPIESTSPSASEAATAFPAASPNGLANSQLAYA
jgi:hypothetical protein